MAFRELRPGVFLESVLVRSPVGFCCIYNLYVFVSQSVTYMEDETQDWNICLGAQNFGVIS